VGVIGGLAVNWSLGGTDERVVQIVSNVTQPIGTLFLSLLLMIVVPLVFSSLVVGVAGIGDIRRLGRVGLRSFAYCLVISAISVVIGLVLANTIRPGERIRPETQELLKTRYGADAQKRVAALESERKAAPESPLMQVVKTIVPVNPVQSMAGVFPATPPAPATATEVPQMLQIMFLALVI